MALSVYLVKDEVVQMDCNEYLRRAHPKENMLQLLKPISVGNLALSMARRGFLSQLEVDSLLESFRKPELANEQCMALNWRHESQYDRFDCVLVVTGGFVRSVVDQLPPSSIRVTGSATATYLLDGTWKDSPRHEFDGSVRCAVLGDFKSGFERIRLLEYGKQHFQLWRKYETRLTLKFSVTLEWDRIISFRPNPCNILQNLFESEETKDVTIVAYDGEELKCHGVVLAASSPVFAVMLNPGHRRRIKMPRISGNVLKLLIQFIYGKEIPLLAIHSSRAVVLFKTAHQLELSELERELSQMLLQKRVEWFKANALVSLYTFVKDLDGYARLRERALRLMTKMTDSVRSCRRFKRLRRSESRELVWTLLNKKSG